MRLSRLEFRVQANTAPPFAAYVTPLIRSHSPHTSPFWPSSRFRRQQFDRTRPILATYREDTAPAAGRRQFERNAKILQGLALFGTGATAIVHHLNVYASCSSVSHKLHQIVCMDLVYVNS